MKCYVEGRWFAAEGGAKQSSWRKDTQTGLEKEGKEQVTRGKAHAYAAVYEEMGLATGWEL